jgi:zinc finger SWIM domain-containing protein 3
METPSTTPLYVDATFDTLADLKRVCKAYAIEKTFEYKVRYTNKIRYTIKCKEAECPWRLHSSSVSGSSLFRIRKYEDKHTCFGLNHRAHAQADKAFIATHIAEKLKEQPAYRPVDIVKDVQRELGVQISYRKAIQSKERANELNNGTHKAAYQALPKYCEDIIASNANSVAILEKTPDDKFKRLFICYGACSSGFAYCRPLLGLDGTHSKTKYLGTLSDS